MKADKIYKERLNFVVKVKAAYRRNSHAVTWEKIAAIERMRKASKIAKAGNVRKCHEL